MRAKSVAAPLLAIGSTFCLPAARADNTHLWHVEMMQSGKSVACDASAQGMAGRPPYEVRFRREKNRLLLIIAYDGPRIGQVNTAKIMLDRRSVGEMPAVASKFGTRNAVLISINPNGFDFHQFDGQHLLGVTLGTDRFEIAFLPGDSFGSRMDICLATLRDRQE
ncbi:MAG: hypothetical protein ACLPX9_05405 [Rhodomicrobium sp.]